jgi:hypothetical protein
MTVVNTKEFNANQEKYFDMAMNECIFIQRGDCTFIVVNSNEPKMKHKKPDSNLHNAVTMDEVKERLNAHIHKLFANQ